MTQLYEYIRGGKDRVEGWFGRVDSQIFHELLTFQNDNKIAGAVTEIGVHHGKSFIALCLALRKDERAYAIDVFENQEKNLDGSGKGNKNVFVKNLGAFKILANKVVIDARASDEVAPNDIIGAVGAVRFFSIDGGHWRKIVRNDLRLACSVLDDAGVIALDDFLRPEWPEVSTGFFDWYEESNKKIVPFAIGFNKLYLCRTNYLLRFQRCLEESEFLRYFLTKHCDFNGLNVPVFQSYVLPEWGLRRRSREYLRLYHPGAYVKLRKLGRMF